MKKMLKQVMLIAVIMVTIGTSFTVKAASGIQQPRDDYATLYVKTEGGNLNVREKASLSAKVLGRLKNGTQILGWSIFGMAGDGYNWTSIRAIDINNVEVNGWVVDDYLTTEKPKAIRIMITENVG